VFAIWAVKRLLDLQAPRVGFHQARQLGDANHAAAREIADVHAADDGCHVVFAMRLEPYVSQHHDLVVAFHLLEGPLQDFLRVGRVAREPFLKSASDPGRRTREPLAIRIVAGPTD
jgi:hypothetical protein